MTADLPSECEAARWLAWLHTPNDGAGQVRFVRAAYAALRILRAAMPPPPLLTATSRSGQQQQQLVADLVLRHTSLFAGDALGPWGPTLWFAHILHCLCLPSSICSEWLGGAGSGGGGGGGGGSGGHGGSGGNNESGGAVLDLLDVVLESVASLQQLHRDAKVATFWALQDYITYCTGGVGGVVGGGSGGVAAVGSGGVYLGLSAATRPAWQAQALQLCTGHLRRQESQL